MEKVKFLFHDKRIILWQRQALKQFIVSLFIFEGHSLKNITYIFCSDQYLLKINREFLKHDYYTDIITFDLSSSPKNVEAEAYISVDRVRENAKSLECPVNKELHRVIFHGALHLCGYRDKKNPEIEQMRMKEELYLINYFNNFK